jgi:hypothetical protein
MTGVGGATDPRERELRRRTIRTGRILLLVILGLAAGAACFIARDGRKSHEVLHSEIRAARAAAV